MEHAGQFGYFVLVENTHDIMWGWGGEQKSVSYFLLLFSFKAEDTTIWEVIWGSKLLGLDPIAGVFVQNMAELLGLPSHHRTRKLFPGDCSAGHVVASLKEVQTLVKATSSIQESICSGLLASIKLKSLTVVPSLSSDPWLAFSLLSLSANGPSRGRVTSPGPLYHT